MNVAFIIDNSISMNQRAYNGLSLCEIAKNGVEFVLKQRLRNMESKYDTYHLFQTGFDLNQKGYPNGVQMLNSYKHDINHFFFQLKNIKTHTITDLPGTLQNVYRQLSMFRYLNGSDNLIGGRDPLKSDPSLIILFTDECDYYQLDALSELIRTNKLQNKWDQQIIIFELMLPSFIEKNILDQETYRKQLQQNNPNSKMFEDIANALGGSTLLIDNYEYLFQIIDTQIMSLFNKTRLNIYLQTSCRSDQESPGFIDSGIKEVFNPISNPLLPSKDIIIMKINAKLNKVFQQAKYKSDIQSNFNYSRILLPEKPAKIEDPKKPELMMNDYPKYIVDFSKIFHANMNKELEFEKQELEISDWSRLVSPYITPFVKEKAYFPLYCTSEFKFNYEETQSANQQQSTQQILIGLLKINCRDGQIIGIDLLYNVWNFLEFNALYEEAIQKKNQYSSSASSSNQLNSGGGYGNTLPQQVEQDLLAKIERYCQKTPFYYWPTIRKILVDKGLQFLADHKYSFLYGEIIQEQDDFVRNMLKFKSKERKKLDDDTRLNRQNHSLKKSSCCAPNSENYEFINRLMHPKSAQRVQLENLLCAKEEILFRKSPKLFESNLQNTSNQINTAGKNAQYQLNPNGSSSIQTQPGQSGDQSISNSQTNNYSHLFNNYLFNNPKLAKKYIKDDYIKRIHFKSEPVSKMSELIRNVKQQEFRDASVDEDEVKYLKEPIPFGNPFKIIVRIKNSRQSNQQNDFMSSEENYLNTNIHQNKSISQNLLTNRLPKRKKLKISTNQQLLQSSQAQQEQEQDNDIRIEGEIKKKIKLSDSLTNATVESENTISNNSSKSELTTIDSTTEGDQIYIVEKESSEDGNYQSNDSDLLMYDPTFSNQIPYDVSQSDQDELYTPGIPTQIEQQSLNKQNNEFQNKQNQEQENKQSQYQDIKQNQFQDHKQNKYQEVKQNQILENKSNYNVLNDQNQSKMDMEEEEEEYNPEISYNYNNNLEQKLDYNMAYTSYDEEKDYDSSNVMDFQKRYSISNNNYPQEAMEDEQTNNQKNYLNEDHTSDKISNQQEPNRNNYANNKTNNDKTRQKTNSINENDSQNMDQGYNPDSDADEMEINEDDSLKKKQFKTIHLENQVKNFIYNKFVYDIKHKQNGPKTNDDIQNEEYDPHKINNVPQDNKNGNNNLQKIEFSTKYLLSPYRKIHQFLIKQKDFFDNLLIFHKSYTRDDLKKYVTKQLKEITDPNLKQVLKQRISEIVYIDKNSNSNATTNQNQQIK